MSRSLTRSELLKIGAFCVLAVIGIIVLDRQEERQKTIDVRTFGAVPNDGKDDTAALQAAIDSSAAQINLPTGTLEIGDVQREQTRSDDAASWKLTIRQAAERAGDAITPYDGPATRKARAAVTQDTWTRQAEASTSSMAPAFPHRKALEWTINRDLVRRRFNLWLLPNVHEGPHECDGEWMAGIPPQLWQNSGFKMVQGVDANGKFPVRIQRVRAGVITNITTVWVPVPPVSSPLGEQISFKSADWREGDLLRIPLDSELLMISCSPDDGSVIEPRLSGVEQPSGDSTPIPGKVVRW